MITTDSKYLAVHDNNNYHNLQTVAMHDIVHERIYIKTGPLLITRNYAIIVILHSILFMQKCNSMPSYRKPPIYSYCRVVPIWLYLVSLHIFNRRMSFD